MGAESEVGEANKPKLSNAADDPQQRILLYKERKGDTNCQALDANSLVLPAAHSGIAGGGGMKSLLSS